MANKISMEPDKLDALATDIATEISPVENLVTDLSNTLAKMVLNADPRFSHCFSVVDTYGDAGAKLIDKMDDVDKYLRSASEKMSEADDTLGLLYGLYESYGTISVQSGIFLQQALYLGSGLTKFVYDADGLYKIKHLGPLKTISDYIDNSKFKNYARYFLDPKFLMPQFHGSSFADLIHKKFTRYLPQDAVDYANSIKNLALEGKGSIKEVFKHGWKFAKTNAVGTILVTGATETFGLSLKISENYAKYGDNPEVLKRENAKATGSALNKTVMVTGGSILGGAIGGAAGSFFGPVGTIAGGAAGSFIGGIAGEHLAKASDNFAQDVALVFKDPIQNGIDGAKNIATTVGKGLEKVEEVKDVINDQINKGAKTVVKELENTKEFAKEGIKNVKNTAENLMNNAKNFFGKPIFG